MYSVALISWSLIALIPHMNLVWLGAPARVNAHSRVDRKTSGSSVCRQCKSIAVLSLHLKTPKLLFSRRAPITELCLFPCSGYAHWLWASGMATYLPFSHVCLSLSFRWIKRQSTRVWFFLLFTCSGVFGRLLVEILPVTALPFTMMSQSFLRRSRMIQLSGLFRLASLNLATNLLRTRYIVDLRLQHHAHLNAPWFIQQRILAVTLCALPCYGSQITRKKPKTHDDTRIVDNSGAMYAGEYLMDSFGVGGYIKRDMISVLSPPRHAIWRFAITLNKMLISHF